MTSYENNKTYYDNRRKELLNAIYHLISVNRQYVDQSTVYRPRDILKRHKYLMIELEALEKWWKDEVLVWYK